MLAPPTAAPRKQAPKGPPNALQGFSQNRDQPVHIQAAELEVHDKQEVATFSGDVRVRQGDTNMRCRTLKVFYERDKDQAKNGAKNGGKAKSIQAATPGPGGQQKIKRLEAIGNVVVTQKGQTASGSLGVFDMKSNTVTLTGKVVLTEGKSVLRGDKLVVDLTSGVSRIEFGPERARPGRGPVRAKRQRVLRKEPLGAASLMPHKRAHRRRSRPAPPGNRLISDPSAGTGARLTETKHRRIHR